MADPSAGSGGLNLKAESELMGFQTFNEALPRVWLGFLDNGSSPGDYPIIDGDGYPSSIDQFWVSNSDGIDHVVWISGDVTAARSVIVSATIPAGSGVGGVPPVQLIPSALQTLGFGLVSTPDSLIRFGVEELIVTGEVSFYGQGGRFN